jgi:hypothetical protein
MLFTWKRVGALAIGALAIASCGKAANQPTVGAGQPATTLVAPATAVQPTLPTMVATAVTTTVALTEATVEVTVGAVVADAESTRSDEVTDAGDSEPPTQPQSAAPGSAARPVADRAIADADQALAEADALLGTAV